MGQCVRTICEGSNTQHVFTSWQCLQSPDCVWHKWWKINDCNWVRRWPGLGYSGLRSQNLWMPISRQLRLHLLTTTPPPVKGVRGGATLCPPLTICLCCPLVKRKGNPWRRPAADSMLQLHPLQHRGGQADKDIKWYVWSGWISKTLAEIAMCMLLQNFIREHCWIKLIKEYGTCWFIKQWGQLSVTQHQTVLTMLEHRVLRYQNSWTYRELEADDSLMKPSMRRGLCLPAATG